MSNRVITYSQAINEAVDHEMQIDPNVLVYGLDVADHKATFGSGLGLAEKYGRERYFSTPLSEDALMGFGLGMALSGLRPINIHIRVDFLLLAMNQLCNMVSSAHYGSAGKLKVPLTIRAVIGRGWGQGFQHSKSLHSLFAHIPGLKVVMPTTAYDAKGLLIDAIRDNNPVLVLEHRWLYWQTGYVPSKPYVVKIGSSAILKNGKDITIATTSWMGVEACKAAEILERRAGLSVEVIDLRSIYPFDDTLLNESIKRTGHCIVADYDWVFCGFSAEVAARASEHNFHYLKSPITRIGFAPTPCPTTRPLENEFYPNALTIIRAIERKLNLPKLDLSAESFYSYENKFICPI